MTLAWAGLCSQANLRRSRRRPLEAQHALLPLLLLWFLLFHVFGVDFLISF